MGRGGTLRGSERPPRDRRAAGGSPIITKPGAGTVRRRKGAALAVRLSLLMFLQFAVLGAWIPVFGPYLKALALDPADTAWVWAASAIGALLGPLPVSQVADRWVAAEKCIAACAFGAGAVLLVMAQGHSATLLFWGNL